MSSQQARLRAQKFLQQWENNNINVTTSKTYLLRDQLNCYSILDLGINERNYIDQRWGFLEGLLLSKSASQLVLKLEVAKCSTTFQLIDFLVLCLGFSQKNYNGYIFKREVLLDLIDKHDTIDNAIKTPRLVDLLLKSVEYSTLHFALEPQDLMRVIAHILKKFPDLLDMNFMLRRSKGGLKRRFTKEKVEKYF